jgi:histidinol-phosphatase (PHP family)
MADMCQAALDRGIPEIAFTEHFDHFNEKKERTHYHAAPFFEDIAQCRADFYPQGLIIRSGVEVGEPHLYADDVQPVLDAYPYDLVLGSLHWVNGESVFQPRFYEGLSAHEAIKPYFEELMVMIEHGGFDILSHMDVFKRRAHLVYGNFAIEDWEDDVRQVWAACLEHNIGIEINTGGLRWKINEAHPNLTALRWYREIGGELLTIGSDAHRPDDLGFGLDHALQIARAAGFSALAQYEQREVVAFIPI